MECDKAYDLLIEREYGHLQESVQDELSSHVERCEPCRIEAASLDELASTLDRWRVPNPPPMLAALAVERSLNLPRHASAAEARAARVFAHLGLGLVAAALSMILVAGSVPRLSIPALSLGLIGAVWAAMYGAAFAQALHRVLRMRTIARTALLGAGLVVLAAPVLSIPSVVDACRQLFAGARGSFGLNMLLFVAGGLYTGIPIFVSAAVCGRALETTSVNRGGGHAGVLFAILIAPAVYIQCAALALGLVATWMAGSLLAAVAGPTAGIWVATRIAARQA
ncbi:MAG: hypothetical protein HY574_11635 [candidate division NC10 bacterium]|nr:hypothetical protein [candidate division NC10 bacterium]